VDICKTSSDEVDAVAIAERLSKIENGVVMDTGCGGGFTTERVLQEIQPSVCCVAVDIDFDCVKITGRRAELLGMSDRFIGICADLRHIPFADEDLAAAYTRLGFGHIHHYVHALKEVYRALRKDGTLVVTEYKAGWVKSPKRVGLSYEEQREILRHLGMIAHGEEFVEHIKQAGFDVLSVDDMPQPKSHVFLAEAAKN
jgi:ubiquinone/menaquinone biosynthesis C-methylase UbiE